MDVITRGEGRVAIKKYIQEEANPWIKESGD